MISGNVPGDLNAAARTGFLSAMKTLVYDWQRVAMQHNMTAASDELVDLGAAPMPTISKQGVTVQDFIERKKTVTPQNWDITVFISYNAVKDDQTGQLETKVRSAGDNFQKHINSRVFTVLNGGDTTTYGQAYDVQDFLVAGVPAVAPQGLLAQRAPAAAEPVATGGRVLRDARLDRYLRAHREYAAALPGSLPGGSARGIATVSFER